MKAVVYTVQRGQVAHNEALVGRALAAIDQFEMDVAYTALRLGENTFVHLVSGADSDSLPSVAEFAEFQQGLPQRLESGPEVHELAASSDLFEVLQPAATTHEESDG